MPLSQVSSLSNQITNYKDATQWIYDRIDYERIRPRQTSTHFRLERVERLLTLIDSPQQKIPCVHIAGTKGKGSTAAILDSILHESGVQTGLFTSPHIELFEERMRVGGQLPSPLQLVSMVNDLRQTLADAPPEVVEDGPTYFEVATLLAWMYFDRQNVDLVVLETGLGGRLDCTNVCSPLLTIITTIGLDHTHILGDTIAKIAAEKAGIMKKGVPLLTWASQPEVQEVFTEHAERLNCEVFRGDREILVDDDDPNGSFSVKSAWGNHPVLRLKLLGKHQKRNAALAVAAADYLALLSAESSDPLADRLSGITPKSIGAGLLAVEWPLRFEVIDDSPQIVLDAAHNPDSIAAFLATLNGFAEPARRRVLIFASSHDKDSSAMLRKIIAQFDDVILTRFARNPRAIEPEELSQKVTEFHLKTRSGRPCSVFSSPAEALAMAKTLAGSDGIVCGTGSIFVAAELRSLLIP